MPSQFIRRVMTIVYFVFYNFNTNGEYSNIMKAKKGIEATDKKHRAATELYLSRRKVKYRENPKRMDKMVLQPKERVHKSIIRGEGINTPHICCTQQAPFLLFANEC